MDLPKRCRPGERVVHAIFLLLALIVAAQRVRDPQRLAEIAPFYAVNRKHA